MHTLPTPTLDQLRVTFKALEAMSVDNVPGVLCIDSGKPGPTFGIMAATHGNEPAGLAPMWYYTKVETLAAELKAGKVYFIVNNLEAAQQYFHADASYEEKMALRFVDINMNRLPEDTLEQAQDTRYEIRRVQTLAEIYRELDVVLDIHSTSQASDPMVIPIRNFHDDLMAGLPIQHIVTGFLETVDTLPVVEFCGNKNAVRVAVEVGSHEDVLSFKRAISCVRAFLINLNMVVGEQFAVPFESYAHYRIKTPLEFPHGYEQAEILPNFALVDAGTVVGVGEGSPVVAPHDGHALFAPATKRPPNYDEAVVFLTHPVEEVEVSS